MNVINVHDTDPAGVLTFVPKDSMGFPLPHPAAPVTWTVDTPGIVQLSPYTNTDQNPCGVYFAAVGSCVVTATDGTVTDQVQINVQPGAETNGSIEFTPGV